MADTMGSDSPDKGLPDWLKAEEPAPPEPPKPPEPAPVAQTPPPEPERPKPEPPDEEPVEASAPGPRVPAWLAYGGIAVVVLLVLVFVTIQFVLPKGTKAKPPEKISKAPPPKPPTPPPPTPPPPTPPPPTPPPPTPPPPTPPTPGVTDQDRIQKIKEAIDEATTLRNDNKFDEAIRLVEVATKEHGDPDKRGSNFITETTQIKDDYLRGYTDRLAAARKCIAEGDLFGALENVRVARPLFPDRREASAVIEEVRKALAAEPMLLVTGREVVLGDDDHADERPRRTVFVRAFHMERTEVTIRHYAIFCLATGHPLPPLWKDKVTGDDRIPTKPYHDLPVNFVTAADAEAYAAWVGRRLPTAEEWEAAARWIDGRVWPWGNTFDREGKLVSNTKESCLQSRRWSLLPVGSFSEPATTPGGDSPYQIADMAGNVWEWTSSVRVDTESGMACRVIKGGSYLHPKEAARASNILLEEPDAAIIDLGFRCVRDAGE